MSPRAIRLGILVLLAGVALGAGLRFRAGKVSPRPALTVVDGGAAAKSDTAIIAAAAREKQDREREIAVYEERATRDPKGAFDLARLAALYLERARDTGDHEDFHRAESAARRSIANMPRRNDGSYLALAASLAGQHRFVEASEVARTLSEAEPDVVGYRAAMGEIQLELGDYAGADSTFSHLATVRNEFTIAPRYARWLELRGKSDEALALLIAARDEAVRAGNLPREATAWFYLRVGDLLARKGRIDEAEKSYRDGLAVRPNDHRLHVALAKTAACRHRWPEALDHARKAADAVPEPATLILVGDAHAGLGDRSKAEEAYRVAEQEAIRRHAEKERAWAMFLVDHDRGVRDVVDQQRKEIKTRHDIYGYDLLAWALYKNRELAAAHQAMASALQCGARDGLVFFHAGMIERARGADGEARHYLQQALATNAYFHPTYPELARAVLDSLGAAAQAQR